MNINRDNYEGFFLLLLDRELGPAEIQEVEKFLDENEDLRKEFALLRETVITPEDIVYEGKNLLLHKEEKRRILPVFWFRVAASVALIITGSWIFYTVLKNNSSETSISKLPAKNGDSLKNTNSAMNPVSKNDNTAVPDRLVKNSGLKNGSGKKEYPDNQNRENRTAQKTQHQLAVVSTDTLNSANESVIPDESVTLRQKAVTRDLQSGGSPANGDPRQVSVGGSGINPSASALAAIPANQIIKNENPDERDQTDNAISVVALNDRNKAITGFFKKITRRAPANENDRKLRVSVFQISY